MSKAKIKFIRAYNVGNTQMIDIIYDPIRVRTCVFSEAPRTALNFIDNSKNIKHEYDILMKRDCVLYL